MTPSHLHRSDLLRKEYVLMARTRAACTVHIVHNASCVFRTPPPYPPPPPPSLSPFSTGRYSCSSTGGSSLANGRPSPGRQSFRPSPPMQLQLLPRSQLLLLPRSQLLLLLHPLLLLAPLQALLLLLHPLLLLAPLQALLLLCLWGTTSASSPCRQR